jgi:hypothetical protein
MMLVVSDKSHIMMAALALSEKLARLVEPVRIRCAGRLNPAGVARNSQELREKATAFLETLQVAHQAIGEHFTWSCSEAITAWVARQMKQVVLPAHQDPYGCLLDIQEAVGAFSGAITSGEELLPVLRELCHRFHYFLAVLNLEIDHREEP